MVSQIRDILLNAVSAARYGVPPKTRIAEAIAGGDRQLTLDELEFDSLSWMEFCISVELQSGQELSPLDIERMDYVFQIEDWLRNRG